MLFVQGFWVYFVPGTGKNLCYLATYRSKLSFGTNWLSWGCAEPPGCWGQNWQLAVVWGWGHAPSTSVPQPSAPSAGSPVGSACCHPSCAGQLSTLSVNILAQSEIVQNIQGGADTFFLPDSVCMCMIAPKAPAPTLTPQPAPDLCWSLCSDATPRVQPRLWPCSSHSNHGWEPNLFGLLPSLCSLQINFLRLEVSFILFLCLLPTSGVNLPCHF